MKQFITIIIAMLVFAGCERKDLYDSCGAELTVRIPIRAVWSQLDEPPKNVSILFYDLLNGELVQEHIFENNDNDIQSYVYLPLGEYKAVVFNELRDQVSYVQSVGYEEFSTLEFVLSEVEPMQTMNSTSSYVGQAGEFAVAVVDGIKIEKGVISEKLLDVVPTLKTITMSITVNIKGLNNARMPALADLVNIADSYIVSSDTNSTNGVVQQFTIGNRSYYEGSATDGTVSVEISNFGDLGTRLTMEDQPPELPLTLDLMFMLVDEERTIINRSYNITDIIEYTSTNRATVELFDPTPLPDVKPEGGEDSSFESGVEDWNIVTIPL